ncbi:nuclear transport factor 2 family protein [Sphingobacterium arenae]|uniref:Nuclear transport factor 2 family protein n=1 Tax=Sphingobacterium arenae TaxID=1280598 RepID=A0ABR7Y5X8_9SPHI|nr:nuclear transport factor 2 family protein [Sphingobacterium arenae]MBD1426674.1 nuclear transport factor 2 family protein [Sphingobacterium arenae]
MLKIKVKADCGNSPKREFLKDFNIAFGKGDAKFIIAQVTDEIVWEMIGEQTIEGKDSFSKAINEMKKKEVAEISIEKVVTHGKEGAVNGIMRMKDGKQYAFSDFYEFKNTTSTSIKAMTSYVIEI